MYEKQYVPWRAFSLRKQIANVMNQKKVNLIAINS